MLHKKQPLTLNIQRISIKLKFLWSSSLVVVWPNKADFIWTDIHNFASLGYLQAMSRTLRCVNHCKV